MRESRGLKCIFGDSGQVRTLATQEKCEGVWSILDYIYLEAGRRHLICRPHKSISQK